MSHDNPPLPGSLFGFRHHEAEPVDLQVGIEIEGLRKEFGGKVAVEDVDLKVYRGQITALLGHNGAGKTTTMQMMCGMFRPTAGRVLVEGHDVVTDTFNAQRHLGYGNFDIILDHL